MPGISVAKHQRHHHRGIQPCENELNEHLLHVPETPSTGISEGTKTPNIEETQGVGLEGPRLLWARQEQAPAASRCGDEALRDAAKVKETQGDLPTNRWPQKFLYPTDLFPHRR